MISLEQGARRVVGICGGVRAGERVLVLGSRELEPDVPAALCDAAVRLGAITSRFTVEFEDILDERVRHDMMTADVIFALTRTSIAHTDIGRAAASAGARILAMTRADRDTMTQGAIEADFVGIEPACRALADRLTGATAITVTTAAGTRIEASIAGRSGHAGTGLVRMPHLIMGCPDIEAYVAPLEPTVNGTIVADASSTYFGLVDTPITVEIVDGRAVSITGGRHAAELESYLLRTGDPASFVFAEIGIGLNPNARMIGNIIEDEAVYGSGHFALGTNETFGGANRASTHCDLVYWRPTVWLDGVPVMTDGVLGVEPAVGVLGA